jgi:4-carboxymuconolactone decarboxylase
MARMSLPALDRMTPEQRSVHDEAAGGLRGHAPAQLAAWICNPEFARRAQKLGELLRYQTSLPPRLSELAILVTARHWSAHYEWKVHRQAALNAGLPEAAIAAIAAGTIPTFESEAEQVAFAVSTSLLTTHAVPDLLYQDAMRVLGETGLVDLIGVLGYYGLVSMTLNTFEIGLPDNLQAELTPQGAGA